MDPELDRRLSNIEKMVGDNNKMLSKLRRSQKNATYMRIVYWIIIIILMIAAIYFITPYLGQLASAYGIGSTDNPTTPGTAAPATDSTASTLTKLLNQYEASQKTTQ